MTILNKENYSVYPKNTFPAHAAFLSDLFFGGNLKVQLTSLLLQNTEGPGSPTEESYSSVRSSYSCVPQQLQLMTNPRQKIVVQHMCVLFMHDCGLDCCNFASSFQSPKYFQLQKLLVSNDSFQTSSEQEKILVSIKRQVAC